eukprot:gb/GFBE01028600.1/.p1 GENE.gb/GFBE01028600.1/~~gb/GFBE01028600.1/.p1  ORF type:complete len:307 (+),score=55.98 gb/GFBE01028600.1/:1-921(+)
MPQQSEPHRSKVLSSTLVAAWLVGALTLGRLVHEYVPIGASPKATPSPPRGLRTIPKGVPAAQFIQQDAMAAKALTLSEGAGVPNMFSSFVSGAVGGALAAAVLAFAVGLGVIVPRDHMVSVPGQSHAARHVAAPQASGNPSATQVATTPSIYAKMTADKDTTRRPVSAKIVTPRSTTERRTQLNGLALKLRDSAEGTLRAGHAMPAQGKLIQSATCFLGAAMVARASRQVDAKKSAPATVTYKAPANSFQAAKKSVPVIQTSSKASPASSASVARPSASITSSKPQQTVKLESEQAKLKSFLLSV